MWRSQLHSTPSQPTCFSCSLPSPSLAGCFLPTLITFSLPQDLFPTVVIVFGGLCGLFLDPSAPPLVGGRTSLMIVSMLLIVNMNKGAKRYPYFMWTDLVTCCSLAILFSALAETMIVHQHMRAGRKSHGLALDMTMRWVTCRPFIQSPAIQSDAASSPA